MSVIYVLLSISVIVAIFFFIAFIISVRSGQYDDSYTPSVRMLFEDELVKEKKSSSPHMHITQSKSSIKNLETQNCDAMLSIDTKKRIQLTKSLNN